MSRPSRTVDPEPLPGPDLDRPVPFVVGESRSGTTLLRVMLDAHPELAIPPESYFITGLYRFRRRYERGEVFDLPRFASDLTGLAKFRDWDLPPDRLAGAFGTSRRGDFPGAIRLLYRTYAEVHGKPRFGDKSPGYVARMPLLAELFREGRFVHLVRDPRAVALSLAEMPWGAKDVLEGAARWRHHVGRGHEAGGLLGPERYLEVRYEDLVAEPERELRRVAGFLELPFDPRMLAYADRALERIPESERWQHANLARPPTEGVRDWRTELSPGDLAAVEAICGELMAVFGYGREVSEPPPEAEERARRAVAGWQEWLRKKKRKGRLRRRLAMLRPGRGQGLEPEWRGTP